MNFDITIKYCEILPSFKDESRWMLSVEKDGIYTAQELKEFCEEFRLTELFQTSLIVGWSFYGGMVVMPPNYGWPRDQAEKFADIARRSTNADDVWATPTRFDGF